MMIATLDLRFYADTTHGNTTYCGRARALLPECGSWTDRITTSEKMGGKGRGEKDDARHILRVWQRLTRMIRERRLGRFDLFYPDHNHIHDAHRGVTTIRTNQALLVLCNLKQNYILYIMCFTSVKRGRMPTMKLHNANI